MNANQLSSNSLNAILITVTAVFSPNIFAAEKNMLIEEVIVTAQRRAESAQDVPLAINAFSGEQLRAIGIDSTLDLQLKVPGLSIEPLAGQGLAYLRGIGTDTLSPGLEPTIAIHLDGIYQPRLGSLISNFYDAERIEVIKGPQGTLFGRNATGGVINLISKRPDDEFGGYLDVTVGNKGTKRFEGVVNQPIGDRTAIRLSGLFHENNGYADNRFTGEDEDTIDIGSFRGQLAHDLNDDIDFRLFGDWTQDDSSLGTASHVSAPVSDNPHVTSGGIVLPDIRDTYRDVNADNETDSWGIGTEVNWNLGNVTFKSITSFRDYENRYQVDFDLTDINNGGFQDPAQESDTFIQEFQLASDTDDPWEWITGLYYFNDDASHDNKFYLGSPVPSVSGGLYGAMINDFSDIDAEAFAIFGQVSYTFWEKLRATIGLRWSYEEKDIAYRSFFGSFPGQTGPALVENPADITGGVPTITDNQSHNEDAFTPKFGLDYFVTDDIMLYASATRGFKSGGYNTILFGGAPEYVDPETIWAYEGGFKALLLDGTLRLNSSIFFYDYRDIHANVDLANNAMGFANVRNLGDADIFGIEADAVWAATDRFTLDANISYLDSEIQNGSGIDRNQTPPVMENFEGNPLPRSPEVTYGVGAQYVFPTTKSIGGDVTLRGDMYYSQDERFWSVFSDPLNAGDSYTVVNTRLQYDHQSDQWSIAAFARNLFDEDAESNGFRSNSFGNLRTYKAPRTYGLNVRYNF